MLAHRRGERDGYFLMMLAPERAVPRERIAAKDILFVLDTSGSMSAILRIGWWPWQARTRWRLPMTYPPPDSRV